MVLMLLLAAAPMHSRLVTEHGPVHVAIPPRTAQVTVVYVHGFWTDVDDAWGQHRLAEQLGGVDAVVIAPEAPSGPGQKVRWPRLDALLEEVEARTGVHLPQTVIAIGHSGAYRTLEGWASDERVKSVVLLDAFYGSAQPWERFGGDLRIVARHTAKRSAPFCARHPAAQCETTALSHLGIVTSGSVIPRVLRDAVAAVLPRT
jgi:pimeloyl-ACP methyl ester carboxylesterase